MSEHDSDDPMSYVNAIEAVGLAVKLPPCRHCRSWTRMVPMSGTGWGVELFHQPTCPEHEDNQPAAEHDFNDPEGDQ